MRPYLFTPLLILLCAAAAPLAEDHSDFPALQKRSIACSTLYGRGIIERDCDGAIGDMRRMTVNSNHPGTGQPIPNMGAYSRFNPDGHYRLPQRFSVGTCTIIVDTVDTRLTLPSSWDLVAGGTSNVVRQCVHGNGQGGEMMDMGLTIVVLNEANLSPVIRDQWQRCVNLINMQQNLDSFTHCLLENIDRDTGSNQATSRLKPHQTRTVEGTSVAEDTY